MRASAHTQPPFSASTLRPFSPIKRNHSPLSSLSSSQPQLSPSSPPFLSKIAAKSPTTATFQPSPAPDSPGQQLSSHPQLPTSPASNFPAISSSRQPRPATFQPSPAPDIPGQQLSSHPQLPTFPASNFPIIPSSRQPRPATFQQSDSQLRQSASRHSHPASSQPSPSSPATLFNFVLLPALLETSSGSMSGAHTATLFLSTKLKRFRYGFEHGALEVKSQLEKVLFADIVSSIMIIYARRDTQHKHLSPWVIHFYIDKKRMISRRIDVFSAEDQLLRSYEKNAAFDDFLPKLFIESKYYLPDEKHDKSCDMHCISLAVESIDSPVLLDTLRDKVIPCLLKSLINGFNEFKAVDILWDDSQKNCNGELYLKVTMSENCSSGKFWSSIQNACVPIMDLIDWNRSHPNDTCNISSMFGISAAWQSFLRSLKATTLDVGRNVRQEHLNIMADRLFISGEFHGLSRKGLKVQKDYSTTSLPFTLACFSNPASCFIDAAKQNCEDLLRGTVDAVSWGKESPTGTGGPFEIMYSGKVCNTKENESIYSVLQCQDISHKKMERPPFVDGICYSKSGELNGCTQSEKYTDFTLPRKFISHKNGDSRAYIFNMESSLRAILLKYPINRYVTTVDKEILMKALVFHPSSATKIGTGVKDIKVGHSLEHEGSKCFILVRNDGTAEDFSYHKCVAGAAAQLSPECAAMFEKRYQRRFQKS